mmetsp:Transcript_8134/g.14447  ORF Transcript_8134/g.14447 Transcript_8134/m.14447 type:complete len:208 (+) Transcript_8134:1645-2268(+)
MLWLSGIWMPLPSPCTPRRFVPTLRPSILVLISLMATTSGTRCSKSLGGLYQMVLILLRPSSSPCTRLWAVTPAPGSWCISLQDCSPRCQGRPCLRSWSGWTSHLTIGSGRFAACRTCRWSTQRTTGGSWSRRSQRMSNGCAPGGHRPWLRPKQVARITRGSGIGPRPVPSGMGIPPIPMGMRPPPTLAMGAHHHRQVRLGDIQNNP